MFHRFGFDDENTGHLLLQLAKEEAMPDFTLAYFPDNDYCSHKVGPQEAVTSLEQVDAKIGQFIEILGGLEQALEKVCIIITGDHSQSDMVADEEAGIRLDQLLADFSIADPGLPWNEDDQLIICPDMRAAQIYFHYPDPQQLEQIVTLLIADPRVDQAIWRADLFDQDTLGYHVATAKRGRLHFWLESENEGIAVDDHANHWSWQGELETVDGLYSEQHLTFPTYPNAFERIAGALAAENSGHLWLTAKPGYEFQLADTSIHQGGGSHGSLHALDSTSPLLMAGAPPEVTIPSHPRTIDVAPLCLSILGFSAQPWSDSNQQ
jgi:hypothetical protein